jgi:hypothetical protein
MPLMSDTIRRMPSEKLFSSKLVPIHAALLGPLGALPEFLPHEQQLLPRMGPLVGDQAPHPGRLDVVVAGHRPHNVPLPCGFVVADRQHIVLAERV